MVGDVASQMKSSSPLTRTDASSVAGQSLEKENYFVRATGNPSDDREDVDNGAQRTSSLCVRNIAGSFTHGHSANLKLSESA
jgi:hypothetical protein